MSRLCFGTLTFSKLQQNLSISDGVHLLELAFLHGVNFADTAELYDNYGTLREAIRIKPDLIVSTKCYAYDQQTAEQSLKKAFTELSREYIDLFLLHEQESGHTLRGHMEALEFFLRKKEQGVIGAVGISTHFIAGVRAARRQPWIDVIHPLINMTGIGIADGSREEMLAEIEAARAAGKGIFAMKALGGGHLLRAREEALAYALSLPCIDAIAVGMQSEDEVRSNCRRFSGEPPEPALEKRLARTPRRLMIHDWCCGCGACAARCGNRAMTLVDGKARAGETCTLCGYCAAGCPQFCIKVV